MKTALTRPRARAAQENMRPPPTFFPLDEKMAFIPAAILGFQHMIAMLIGLITPATIMANNTNDQKTKLYMARAAHFVLRALLLTCCAPLRAACAAADMLRAAQINASIIVAGIMTIIQSSGVKHPKIPFQWGAGTLSVMGVSFTTVPIAQTAVPLIMSVYPDKAAGLCDFNYGCASSARFARGRMCADSCPPQLFHVSVARAQGLPARIAGGRQPVQQRGCRHAPLRPFRADVRAQLPERGIRLCMGAIARA